MRKVRRSVIQRASAALVAAALMLQPGCEPFQFHTQEFGPGQNNLDGIQLYFIPTPGGDFYQRLVMETRELGNDPAGDTVANVAAGPVEVALGANAINFYGTLYDTIVIGANGTIGMGAPGGNHDLQAHFTHPQVSLLPVDPGGIPQGSVTYDVVPGSSVAVTYAGVSAGGAPATAQAEFFVQLDMYGDIALTYAEISMDAAGVVGLSKGYTQTEIDTLLSTFGFQAPLSQEVMTGTVPAEA